jgi:hypothetical protein
MSNSPSQNLYNTLKEINDTTEYVVDQAYVDDVQQKLKKYKNNNGNSDRSDLQKNLDIDCEFADVIVNKSGNPAIMEASNIRQHDFRYLDASAVIWCVDNKVVHEDTFYLHDNKYMQYLKSYNEGKLHAFAFWRFETRPIKPLAVGDKPKMHLLKVIPAGELLMKMCKPKEKTRSGDKFVIRVI